MTKLGTIIDYPIDPTSNPQAYDTAAAIVTGRATYTDPDTGAEHERLRLRVFGRTSLEDQTVEGYEPDADTTPADTSSTSSSAPADTSGASRPSPGPGAAAGDSSQLDAANAEIADLERQLAEARAGQNAATPTEQPPTGQNATPDTDSLRG